MLNPNIAAGPSSDFMMPTGSNLDINKVDLNFMIGYYSGDLHIGEFLHFQTSPSVDLTNENFIPNQGYLNKIKKQLERREEKASMRQLSTSLPLPNTTLPNTTLPTTLPTNSPMGLSAASSSKTPLAPSPACISKTNPPNGAKTATQAAAANKQNSNKQTNTQHEMQRLKGLGLTVSVDQVLKSPAPQSKANLVSGQKPPGPGVSGQKPPGQGVSGQKPEEVGTRQVASMEKKPIAVKPTSTAAPSYSTAQKLQLKSQVGNCNI